MVREQDRQAKRQKAFADHAWTFFALAYVFYPTLSFLQFQGLVCVGYDDEAVRLLKADLSIDCENDDDYQLFLALNAVFITATQLIPILSFVALYRVRHLLHPPSKRSAQAQLRDRQKREQEEPKLRPVAFLCE